MKKVSLKKKYQHNDRYFILWTILPAVLIIFAIKGYPLLSTFFYSFTNWDGIAQPQFVGLNNYVSLFQNSDFWTVTGNTFYMLLYIPLQIVLGLAAAMYYYEERPGWRIFRILFYLPQMISMVIIGYLFAIIFAYDGAINKMLLAIGLSEKAIDWLGNSITSLPIIMFSLVWLNIGWQALIFSGGLTNMDQSVLDAAELDGAGYFARIFRIILPMLGRTVEYTISTCVIWVFTAIFPIIFSMTHGGPGYETTTLDYMVYTLSFNQGRYGLACALAVVLTVVITALTRTFTAISDKTNSWQG